MQSTFPLSPRRVVVKLGTGILTNETAGIDTLRIAEICRQINELRGRGADVIVVSSGAVGLGMARLGLTRRPQKLERLQACAAIGQSILIQLWQQGFEPFDTHVAQLLVTRDDLRSRARHIAARNTLNHLLSEGVVPVVNENDSVSAAEIKFGDNDVLSAMVASLTNADFLFILSTVPGLMDLAREGAVVPVVEKITPEIERLAGGTRSATAVGGMITKIGAARIANRSGCGVFIASGSETDIIPRLLRGEAQGTFFVPSGLPMEAKKRWLAFFEKPHGTVLVDDGAQRALRESGSSLLAIGVKEVQGNFQSGDIVNIAGHRDRQIFARGVSRYSSEEVRGILGKKADELQAIHPRRKRLEVVHRDALVVMP
jgi:glutamate 5-kinase